MILAGDIGGTKCNLAVFEEHGASLQLVFKRRYATSEFSSLEELIDTFFRECAAESGAKPEGNIAAATSTGGTTNKKAGRVGDSPIIGGGTYANNATCAVSATGDGEYFIRSVVAHDISALMEYRGMKLQEAAQMVLDKVAKLGGTGGLIAIDHDGNIALPFNTSGMYRGHVGVDGEFVVEIYR